MTYADGRARALGRMLVMGCFTVALAACSNGSGAPDASTDAEADGGTGTCTGDFDCPNASDSCFFAINGGCGENELSGTCIPYTPPASCATPNVACGCDGTTISVCAPAGYVNRPSSGPGECPPMPDAGDGGDDDGSATDAAGE